jgi:hypothetical protein
MRDLYDDDDNGEDEHLGCLPSLFLVVLFLVMFSLGVAIVGRT